MQFIHGTFVGDGTLHQSVSCSFAPDYIGVWSAEIGGVNPGEACLVQAEIIRDMNILCARFTNGTNTSPSISGSSGITDLGTITYTNGAVDLFIMNQSSNKFFNGKTYEYVMIKF